MTATMRHLLTSLGEEHRRCLKGATTPEARISAVVRASFASAQFTPAVISAWLAFYMQAQTGPGSRHLLRIYARRLVSNLSFALAQMMPRERARENAEIGAALIDRHVDQVGAERQPPVGGSGRGPGGGQHPGVDRGGERWLTILLQVPTM